MLAMLVVAPAVLLAFCLVPVAGGQPSAPPPSAASAQQEQEFIAKYCTSSTKTSIPAGSRPQAELYYRELAGQIGFQVTASTKLDDVLVFLGYAPAAGASPITAQELQDAAPTELMDNVKLGARLGGRRLSAGDVLVARFFAPKISDVSQSKVTQAGWRKLVLLRAQPGSPAFGRVDYGIILFNFFAPLSAPDPFKGNESLNTQTIFVGAADTMPLFWLDFERTSAGAPLRYSLSAFFDAGHVANANAPSNAQTAEYFVPCGCVACHGGLRFNFSSKSVIPENRFRAPLLDYLDTDHWSDRIQTGDDFAGLVANPLFDPGTFGVILEINQMIARQNATAQPDSMLRTAADHWVSYHLVNGPGVQPLFERVHTSSRGGMLWDPNNALDRELLPKLNRFCFRCHGSVRFDLFDKEMVRALVPQLNAALQPRNLVRDPRKAMPPDRTLSPAELTQLRNLVKQLP